jgi:hypothetical protein
VLKVLAQLIAARLGSAGLDGHLLRRRQHRTQVTTDSATRLRRRSCYAMEQEVGSAHEAPRVLLERPCSRAGELPALWAGEVQRNQSPIGAREHVAASSAIAVQRECVRYQ